MIGLVYIAVKNLFEENIVFDWCPKEKKNLNHREKEDFESPSNKTKINLTLYSFKVIISGFLI